MARFGEHAAWFEFTSDRFDTSSDLPEDANAGNRFYGRDVAELVAAGLGSRGFDASFLDEDWGWQAHAAGAEGRVLEVSIYHDPDEVATGEWALMVRSLQKERKLGLTRFREVPADPGEVRALEQTFREAGVELRPGSPR
jgi:hypothetical protein